MSRPEQGLLSVMTPLLFKLNDIFQTRSGNKYLSKKHEGELKLSRGTMFYRVLEVGVFI